MLKCTPSVILFLLFSDPTCKRTKLGKEYTGKLAVTKHGKTCQRWTSQSPHVHKYNNLKDFPDSSLEAADNFCRNPDNAPPEPWCLTTDPKVEWEYCDILHCPSESISV